MIKTNTIIILKDVIAGKKKDRFLSHYTHDPTRCDNNYDPGKYEHTMYQV